MSSRKKSLRGGVVRGLVAALVAGLIVPTIGVTSASAAGINPYATADIELVSTGTGHGTPSATFVNTANGYKPGDDSADDGVVASGDRVSYNVKFSVQPGNERRAALVVDLPEYLTATAEDNPNFCVNNKFISSDPIKVIGNKVICGYDLKKGKTVSVQRSLNLVAKDTAGLAKTGQVATAGTSALLDGTNIYSKVEADPVTVVSAPAADFVLTHGKCKDGTCGVYNYDTEKRGKLTIQVNKLKHDGYATHKGASVAGEWSGKLDVSSFPANTQWKVRGEAATSSGGKLTIPKGIGNADIDWTVTDYGIGAAEFYKEFKVGFEADDNSLSTKDYKNNGDGWEPGCGKPASFSTVGERGTDTRYMHTFGSEFA